MSTQVTSEFIANGGHNLPDERPEAVAGPIERDGGP
jgi:hypothetical protein